MLGGRDSGRTSRVASGGWERAILMLLDVPAVDGADAPVASPVAEEATQRRVRASHRLTVVLVLILALPLLIALLALREPTWYPVADLAQTELRIRDVGSDHTPLIGVTGRIGTEAWKLGSHPGPLGFYAVAPVYRLFGGSSWAMELGVVVVHIVALATVLWMVARRSGPRLACGVALVLAVLLRFYGPTTLTTPWNPNLPLLCWLAFVVAVWCVACDDVALLPIVVVTGTFCAQNHLAWAVPVGGLTLMAVAFGVRCLFAARAEDKSAGRSPAVWLSLSAAIGLLLWLPPLIDEFTNDPGNITLILRYFFSNSGERAIGLSQGLGELLRHLDPIQLLTARPPASLAGVTTAGSGVLGAAVLVLWVASAILARRRGSPALGRLNLVLGVTLILAAVAMSRISGPRFSWLTLWAWGINALMLMAIGWTAGLAFGPYFRRRRATRPTTPAALVVVVLVLLGTTAVARAAVDGATAQPPDRQLSLALGQVVGPTAEALSKRAGQDSVHASYLVTWNDFLRFGAQGWGLVNELERRGFDVGVSAFYRPQGTPHRVLAPGRVAAEVHLAVGADIDQWRKDRGAVEVAHKDPRSAQQRSDQRRVRRQLIASLRAAGRPDLVPEVDENLTALVFGRQTPRSLQPLIYRLLEFEPPLAVFVKSHVRR